MSVSSNESALQLRRIRVEDGIDRVRVRGLKTGVLLEAIPDAILRVDGVVDLHNDQVFAVAVVERGLALAGTAIAVCAELASDVYGIPMSKPPLIPMDCW